MLSIKYNTIKQIFTLPKISLYLDGAQEQFKFYNQLHPKYKIIKRKTLGVCLVDLRAFESHEEYLKTINGKNSAAYYARKAQKRGYSFQQINRNDFIDQIYEINTSAEIRQGIPMLREFTNKVEHFPDERHYRYYGVLDKEGILRSYCWSVVSGQVMIVDTLLGHKKFLNDGIMYLLLTNIVKESMKIRNVTHLMYDMYFGGQKGLKMFKTKLGFQPYHVKWKKIP